MSRGGRCCAKREAPSFRRCLQEKRSFRGALLFCGDGGISLFASTIWPLVGSGTPYATIHGEISSWSSGDARLILGSSGESSESSGRKFRGRTTSSTSVCLTHTPTSFDESENVAIQRYSGDIIHQLPTLRSVPDALRLVVQHYSIARFTVRVSLAGHRDIGLTNGICHYIMPNEEERLCEQRWIDSGVS